MIPPTNASTKSSRSILFTKGLNTNRAMQAPNGSLRPDKVAMAMARVLLPVAAYIGAAIIRPSGMLCIAIAPHIMGPTDVKALKATAKPSGCRQSMTQHRTTAGALTNDNSKNHSGEAYSSRLTINTHQVVDSSMQGTAVSKRA
jgi:hypothetical protein